MSSNSEVNLTLFKEASTEDVVWYTQSLGFNVKVLNVLPLTSIDALFRKTDSKAFTDGQVGVKQPQMVHFVPINSFNTTL